jgi:hypothetical protein
MDSMLPRLRALLLFCDMISSGARRHLLLLSQGITRHTPAASPAVKLHQQSEEALQACRPSVKNFAPLL